MTECNFCEFDYIDAENILYDKEYNVLVLALKDNKAVRVPRGVVLQVLEVEPNDPLAEKKALVCQIQKLKRDKVTSLFNFMKKMEQFTQEEEDAKQNLMKADNKLDVSKWKAVGVAIVGQKNTYREIRHAIKLFDIEWGKLLTQIADLEAEGG